jgi:hypothetical protein
MNLSCSFRCPLRRSTAASEADRARDPTQLSGSGVPNRSSQSSALLLPELDPGMGLADSEELGPGPLVPSRLPLLPPAGAIGLRGAAVWPLGWAAAAWAWNPSRRPEASTASVKRTRLPSCKCRRGKGLAMRAA